MVTVCVVATEWVTMPKVFPFNPGLTVNWDATNTAALFEDMVTMAPEGPELAFR